MIAIKEVIAISNGPACTSQRYKPSHVLTPMALSDDRAQCVLSRAHTTPFLSSGGCGPGVPMRASPPGSHGPGQ